MKEFHLYTDASLCLITKTGGWGCLFKTKLGPTTYSGCFKENVDDSTDAELRAIVNGFTLLSRNNNLTDSVVFIYTDSINAIRRINGETRKSTIAKRPHLQYPVDALKKITPPGCSIRMVKVKAHTRETDFDSRMNRIVDKLAGEALGAARLGRSYQLRRH